MIQRQDSLRDKLHQQVRLKYVRQKKIDEAIVPALQSRFNLHTQMRNSRRHSNIFHSFPCKTDYFKTSFFFLVIKLVLGSHSSGSDIIFCNALFKLIWPAKRNIYN